MSLLDHPKAVALLEDAELSSRTVVGCRDRLTGFLQRYLPWFYREEQRELATIVIQGKLSNLERKTTEPIARQAKRNRGPVQHFVGGGKWDDDAVLRRLWKHVAEELGDENAVLVIDPSGFAKKGTESCGVARQWCGRLGKIDNCQVGVFVTYAAACGHTLVDHRLYLPRARAEDAKHRAKCYVPDDILFQEKWRIGLDQVDRVGPYLPHAWVAGDDELGRVTEFRAQLRLRGEQYVLDVPSNTLVREIAGEGPRGAFERIDRWAARQPVKRWKTLTIRDGEKEPVRVKAIKRRVQTKDAEGRVGPTETALVVRTLDKESHTYYALSNASRDVELPALIRPKLERNRVEQDLKMGKQEVGLGHYEVRSWVGWHHHMTLSFLALWFLMLENMRLQKKCQR